MSDITTAKTFWDSVSSIYSGNQMTSHYGDIELEYVFREISSLDKIDNLVCLGVADGCRDPIEILRYLLSKNKLDYSMKVYCNDLSSKMVDRCRERMKEFPQLSLDCIDGPMGKLGESSWTCIDNNHTEFVLGVYNSDYIVQSLEIYKKESDLVGKKFSITFLEMDSKENLVISPESLDFYIDNYKNYLDVILNWKNSSRFIAYSINTSNGFISHYYSSEGINKILKSVFKDQEITTNILGDRYIVNLIKNESNDKKTFITCLNNVLGNIPWHLQSGSLFEIKKLFY